MAGLPAAPQAAQPPILTTPPTPTVALDAPSPAAGSPAPGTQPGPFGYPTFEGPLSLTAPLAASTHAAAAGSSPDSAVGSGPSPSQPLPAPSGASASAGGIGGAAGGILFALLVSLAAFGLRHSTRLRLSSFAWRPQAFVAVIERPG